MLFYHLAYPTRGVESLKEVIVSLEFQLFPGKVSLHEVQQASDLGVGGIVIVAKEDTQFKHEIRSALRGEFAGSDLHGFL
jgi:hypothetical protein